MVQCEDCFKSLAWARKPHSRLFGRDCEALGRKVMKRQVVNRCFLPESRAVVPAYGSKTRPSCSEVSMVWGYPSDSVVFVLSWHTQQKEIGSNLANKPDLGVCLLLGYKGKRNQRRTFRILLPIWILNLRAGKTLTIHLRTDPGPTGGSREEEDVGTTGQYYE